MTNQLCIRLFLCSLKGNRYFYFDGEKKENVDMEYYGTLGPACKEAGILKDMFRAGMTGVRLNLSHGDLEENGHWLELVADAAKECRNEADAKGMPVPQILIDLRGPEVRIGKLKTDVRAEEGSRILFGDGGIPVPEVVVSGTVEGDHILVDDGKLEFVAEKCAERITARVLRGGIVKSEKSLALVGKALPMPTLTESDRRNIAQAAGYGVTGVMLPFVRNKEDLRTLKEALCDAGADNIRIFAKIENTEGVEAIDELLPFCDHVVIARGDLGNSMPLWKLPGVQKRLAAGCRAAEKPFMVVTQMLDSMHERAVPTRAEVLDIYNAVLDGAASLMLTGETAAGKYPVRAMEYLVKTGEEARHDMRSFSCLQR